MGTNDNAPKKAGGKRGTANNANRLNGLLGRTAASTGMADWTRADPRWVVAVVGVVNKLGGAVSFGLSRDGGAHSLTILLDGDRETLWFNGGADLDLELEKVFEMFNTGL